MHAAVSNADGVLELNIGASSLGYSVKNRTDKINSVQVPAISLSTLLKNHAVTTADVIKFDIEGGEEHLFPTESSPQQFARVYIGEAHTDLMDMSKEAFLDLFKEFTVNTETALSDHRFILKASYHVND